MPAPHTLSAARTHKQDTAPCQTHGPPRKSRIRKLLTRAPGRAARGRAPPQGTQDAPPKTTQAPHARVLPPDHLRTLDVRQRPFANVHRPRAAMTVRGVARPCPQSPPHPAEHVMGARLGARLEATRAPFQPPHAASASSEPRTRPSAMAARARGRACLADQIAARAARLRERPSDVPTSSSD
eukprot:2423411-Prymnesium_polylepis.1